jgi:hypothetical protein
LQERLDQFGQTGVVRRGLQVLLIEPAELLGIELRGAAADVIEIEPFDELVHREHLLVAVRPAEPGEVVVQGLGQVAVVEVLHDAHGAVALRETFAVLAEDHRDMAEQRHVRPERAVDVDLARRVVHVVVAADHVRDVHVPVVDHDAEVVRRHAVGTLDHEVVEFLVRDADLALHEVVPGDDAVVRIPEADHRLDAGGGRPASGVLGAPAAVVPRLLVARALLLAHLVEFVLRRVAPVRLALAHQLLDDLAVPVEPLHLIERPFVVVEPEPVHRVEDRLRRCVGGPLRVGVLDAQDEFATMAAGIRPGEQCRAGATDVQIAGGARGRSGCGPWRGASAESPAFYWKASSLHKSGVTQKAFDRWQGRH